MQRFRASELIPHPENEFFFDNMEGQKWQEFLESIRTSGVIEPPVVTDEKIIVAGHQRIRACIECGEEDIFCEVRHYEDKDGRSKEDWILKDLIETNIRQRGVIAGSDMKMRRIILEMERIYGISRGGDRKSKVDNPPLKTQGEIASDLNLTRDEYKMHKKISQMSPEFLELVDTGVVSSTTAYKVVSKLSEEDQLALLEQLPTTQKLTQKQVEAAIAQLKSKTETEISELRRANTIKEKMIKDKESIIEKLESTPFEPDTEDEYVLKMKERMDEALAKERSASVQLSQTLDKLNALERKLRAKEDAYDKEMKEMERRIENMADSMEEVTKAPEYKALEMELQSVKAEMAAVKKSSSPTKNDSNTMREMSANLTKEDVERGVSQLFASIRGNLLNYVHDKSILGGFAGDDRERILEQAEAAYYTFHTVLKQLGWEGN